MKTAALTSFFLIAAIFASSVAPAPAPLSDRGKKAVTAGAVVGGVAAASVAAPMAVASATGFTVAAISAASVAPLVVAAAAPLGVAAVVAAAVGVHHRNHMRAYSDGLRGQVELLHDRVHLLREACSRVNQCPVIPPMLFRRLFKELKAEQAQLHEEKRRLEHELVYLEAWARAYLARTHTDAHVVNNVMANPTLANGITFATRTPVVDTHTTTTVVREPTVVHDEIDGGVMGIHDERHPPRHSTYGAPGRLAYDRITIQTSDYGNGRHHRDTHHVDASAY